MPDSPKCPKCGTLMSVMRIHYHVTGAAPCMPGVHPQESGRDYQCLKCEPLFVGFHVPPPDKDNRISELESALADSNAEVERLKHQPMPLEGHGEPCYYCGERCSAVAGNPNKWPLYLCHPEEPGIVKWHHVGCVSERLQQLASRSRDLNEAVGLLREIHQTDVDAISGLKEAGIETSCENMLLIEKTAAFLVRLDAEKGTQA